MSRRPRFEPRPARSRPRRNSPCSAASQSPASLRSSPPGPKRSRKRPIDCAPPIGTTETPSAARCRPRRSASASSATWSLIPSTRTTATASTREFSSTIASSQPARVANGGERGTRFPVPGEEWFRNALVYSASVETFMDADGDGVGDFAGLCARLDHLESLGVDAIWLTPSQPSPNRDDGYDIADYYGIERRLGSSGDFVQFLHEADGRGIRVLLDLVVNHTSDRHPWFLDARRAEDSRHRD